MDPIRRLESLRRREHESTVALIEALVECLRREDHVAAGYASLWALLVERLRYSPAAASRRNAAVRIVARHASALEMLRAHRTSLTCLAKVAHLLRSSDFDAVLRAIDRATSDDVDRILAARRPVAEPRERVRRKVVRAAPPTPVLGLESAEEAGGSAAELKTNIESPVEERIVLTFSVTPADYARFQRARAKASRKHGPGVSIERTFAEMLTSYVDRDVEPRRTKPSTKRTRHVPNAVRREVEARDGGRCTFVAVDGTRCSATHDLQVDHVVPFACGGDHTEANLRLLCGKHNRWRSSPRADEPRPLESGVLMD